MFQFEGRRWRVSRCALRSYMFICLGVGAWSKFRVTVRSREIYRSANGDRWLLAIDSDTDRVAASGVTTTSTCSAMAPSLAGS
jgi:hypothetical protein